MPNRLFQPYNHRVQVHIRGYGVVHTGGAEFEARKRRKVDLISFDMVYNKSYQIKLITFITLQ